MLLHNTTVARPHSLIMTNAHAFTEAVTVTAFEAAFRALEVDCICGGVLTRRDTWFPPG